ncbi:MAG TPA: tRNA (adenosine(37)-N6)-dimethylallyltransferase MiaA, partial [Verrucomicrobiae bacterium]
GFTMANTEIHLPSSILHPLFIAGPTAVGKSALALALAEKIGGEIISVDSMQVYRGLNIGTAKPTAEELARVPHHLLDVCELAEAFDAAQFVRLARMAVAAIQSRNRTPIFCGGTGLYFQAYLNGLADAPAADENLRAELRATPLEQLLAELQERDPECFAQIDRQNPRRVIRAVEVIRLTGRKFSEQRVDWRSSFPQENGTSQVENGDAAQPLPSLICLTRAPADLHQRINVRVDEMFSRGLVEETRELLPHGLAKNQNAMQAIGYRQVVEYLRGDRGLPETIELVKSRTRKFAKRQLTWFRRYGNCRWIELGANEPVSESLALLAQAANQPIPSTRPA